MKISLRQIVISLLALILAITTIVYIAQNAVGIGYEHLWLRALVLGLAIVACLIAVYPLNPAFRERPVAYAIAVCLPAVIPGFIYYLLVMPSQAGGGLSAEQLNSQLITDSSSNGIIEVGFSYPIFTPLITVENHELFTKEVNVFLRMIDGSNESALFRAVRKTIPGSGLSVESTVRGMLSENEAYVFIPLQIPPLSSVTGQLAFVISNLDDGIAFTDALDRASQAQFELREPETGELILEFPLSRI